MPLAAAALCPYPPLLVPQFASGAATELDELRAACRAAVTLLLGSAPDEIVVVGPGPAAAQYPAGTRATLRPWGVDLPVTLGGPGGLAGGPPADLPLSLAIGGWLLGAPARPVRGAAVPADWPPARCAELGRDLVAGPRRTALLVMGDGSTCRTEKAPGYLDPRAEPFDAAVARALAARDAAALLKIDPELAAVLNCSGRAPWQVLAGAAETAENTAAEAAGEPGGARLLYDDAPYGVGYLVAAWT